MSSLKDEVPTETSEDFGFKLLGQKQILPSFNEKLPFASLQNLAISNSESLFIAASGNKVAIGELQNLRDHVTSNSTPLTFRWEKEIADVMFVCFHGDQALISTKNTLYSINLEKWDELQTVSSFEIPVCQLKIFKDTLIFLNSDSNLKTLDLNTKSTEQLAQNVASFDLSGSQLLLLLNNRSFQNFSLQTKTPSKQFEFSVPSELEEFSVEEYASLNVTILSKQIYLVVFGNSVSETDEEASYDQKMFIIKYMNGSASFQETFDITPPFGQMVRFPYIYKITLPDLVNPAENINILASSCSSEVSIWDSKAVIEPSQDAERVVLPISEETDMDTNPIGVAVDMATSGTISEPCSGVDVIEKLPLIYILNNEGNLQIVGLFHVAAIKHGRYNVNIGSQENKTPISPPSTSEKKEQAKEADKELKKSSPSDNPFTSPDTSGFSFLKNQPKTTDNLKSQNSSAFGDPSLGSSAFSFNSSSIPSGNSGTVASEQSAASAVFGKPAFGKPSFGTPAFGAGTTAAESFTSGSTFGKPSFGTPAFGSGAAAAEPSNSGSTFGKPSFGTPAFGSGAAAAESSTSGSTFGKPSFGTPTFGSGAAAAEPSNSGSTFGKPSFGTPAFGSGAVAAEPSNSGSTFGKPSFGTPVFGSGATAAESSTSGFNFGKPSFGSSPFASTTNEPFGSLNQSSTTSPFASFGKDSEEKSNSDANSSSTPFDADIDTSNKSSTNAFDFGSSSFGSSSFSKALNSVDTDTHFKSGIQSSPFSSQLGNNSPFDSLTQGDNKPIENSFASGLNGDDEDETNNGDENEINDSSVSDDDLTDSTIEQTASNRLPESFSNVDSETIEEGRPKSSIGRLTETIKKSANIDIADLKNPLFEGHIKAKSESPFSAFATNINKPSSTTPAFSFGSSAINKKNTSVTPNSSENTSYLPAEKIGDEKSCEKDVVTLKIEENPFLPKKEGNDKESGEEKDSLETRNADSAFNAKESENALEEVSGTSKQLRQECGNLQPHSENSNEQFKTKAKDNGHVIANEDVNSRKTEKSLENNGKTDQQMEGKQEDELDSQKDDKKKVTDSDAAIKEFEDRHFEENVVKEQDTGQNNEAEESDDETPSNSDQEGSISESYDKLEDIDADELPYSGEALRTDDGDISADFNVQTSLEDNYAESGIQTDLSESSQENEVQTDAIPVKHHSTQTIEKKLVDNSLQTDPVETCNFSVQAFEEDENYLAAQYKPKPLGEYYTGANLSNISFVSKNSTLRLIESTFQMVEAEFTVLKGNIENMDEFFVDQSSTFLEKRTIDSINNFYTWRIPEAGFLLNIQNDIKSKDTEVTNAHIQDLKEKVANYVEKNITEINENITNTKEQYSFLAHFNEAPSGYVKDLSTHQFRMRKSLRQKLSNISTEINHIEELLNILKLFSVKNKRLDENPLVTKLAKESLARDELLQEIKSLREDVSRLQLKEKSTEYLTAQPHSSLIKDIKGSKVVEVGLAMNTKKQIGDFFKNLNLAK